MTARPEGRAVKPGLERRFFAGALRCARFGIFRREQHDLAVEVQRQRPDLNIDAVALRVFPGPSDAGQDVFLAPCCVTP